MGPRAAAACLAAAGLSLLVLPAAPSYDAWSWLLWGRELAGGDLSTAAGPAFKPLAVAIAAALAPLGDAAPVAWVWLMRAAAFAALVLAYRVAVRLAGAGPWPGVAAAAGVALAGGWVAFAAAGDTEPLLVACALLAVDAWLAGRPRLAVGAGLACALIRVEAAPFLLAAMALHPPLRRALVPAALVLPAAWLLPDLAGSGDLLRSFDRARVPNPGQPALAAVPSLEAAGRAAGLALWPLPLALLIRGRSTHGARVALALGVGGLAWIVLVAAMAELGFSGEERYALPGVAVASVGAAAALGAIAGPGRRRRVAAAAVAVALAVAGGLRLAELAPVAERQAHQARLAADLEVAVAGSGGRAAVLACGTPYTGPLRGPMVAWALGVEKRRVEFEPRGRGVVFRSRLHREEGLEPGPPAAAATGAPGPGPAGRSPRAAPSAAWDTARHGEWVVARHCY